MTENEKMTLGEKIGNVLCDNIFLVFTIAFLVIAVCCAIPEIRKEKIKEKYLTPVTVCNLTKYEDYCDGNEMDEKMFCELYPDSHYCADNE